jgi:hypothetical protein
VADRPGQDFFISYTQVNRPWAEWIAVQLEAAGYTTLLQAWDFRPGSDFIHQMQPHPPSGLLVPAPLRPVPVVSRSPDPAKLLTARHVEQGWSGWRMRAELRVGRRGYGGLAPSGCAALIVNSDRMGARRGVGHNFDSASLAVSAGAGLMGFESCRGCGESPSGECGSHRSSGVR